MLELASWVSPLFTVIAFVLLALAIVRASRNASEAIQSIDELSAHVAEIENRKRAVFGLNGGEPMAANLEDVVSQIADLHTRNAAFQRQVNDRLSTIEGSQRAAYDTLNSNMKQLWDKTQAAPDATALADKARVESVKVSGERIDQLQAACRQSFWEIDAAFSDLKARVETAEVAASEATKLGVEVANARATSKAAMDAAIKAGAAAVQATTGSANVEKLATQHAALAERVDETASKIAGMAEDIASQVGYAAETRKGVYELANFATRTDETASETARVVAAMPSPVQLRAAMMAASTAAEKAEKAAADAAGVVKTVEALAERANAFARGQDEIVAHVQKTDATLTEYRVGMSSVIDELSTAIGNIQAIRIDLDTAREALGSVGKQGMLHHERIEGVANRVEALNSDAASALKAVSDLTRVATEAVRRAEQAEGVASKALAGGALEINAALDESVVGEIAKNASEAVDIAKRVSSSQSQLTSRVTAIADAVADGSNKLSGVQRAIEIEMAERMKADAETRVHIGGAVDSLAQVTHSLSSAYGDVSTKINGGLTDSRVDSLLHDIASIKASVAKIEFKN